jgi:malonyl CoA-acyl carrier protein transacylase
MYTRWGGFLNQVDEFDASFFDITPREAEQVDPQQRLLLEVAWEALENAGVPPKQLAGSSTGVFVGISNSDYNRLLSHDVSSLTAYNGTGTAFCIAANRLSYSLDLKGSSLAIDTACSSSLVAVHYACQSLQTEESDLCLAGGVNLILSPEVTITFSQARMMAADGRCKTFDASADGYVRGEGCGVVILKRLADALRDRDNIQAVIKGSAVNQDGLTNGMTAPNGLAQQAVIRQALNKAGVAPAEISYVEAHGTGTALGDPQEFKALKTVLMEDRCPNQPCWMGSVKTNIGHLEAAAGIASLIKVILSLQHQEIPPHLHLKQLNRYISLEGTSLAIPTQRQPWWVESRSRLAGVSSFGFGGTNCHIIVAEAPCQQDTRDLKKKDSFPVPHLLTLSAKNENALRELAQRYIDYLPSHPQAPLADICLTAYKGRSHFNYRLAVIAHSPVQLCQQLEAFLKGSETAELLSGRVVSRKPPKLAFLFTGQGSQYVGMGRELYETQPAFRQALDRCAEILQPYLEKPLLQVLYPPAGELSPLDETAYAQPALFALEYALYQVWKAWGIEPTAVMGHSVGEYVAACVAGVFSLEDGLKLVAERGRLMQVLPQEGAMVAVFADEAQVREAIQGYEQEIAIAAINGPQSFVISGKRQSLEMVRASLEAQGIKTKVLNVSHAFHSPLMEPMIETFRRTAQQVTYSQPRLSLISNITGKLATADLATPEYWCRHVLEPVRFAAGMETLHQNDYQVFVEIGSNPVLLGMSRYFIPEQDRQWLPSLRQGQGEWQQMLQSLSALYVKGFAIDWSGFAGDSCHRYVPLPTYPFQRQRYWFKQQDPQQQAEGASHSKTHEKPKLTQELSACHETSLATPNFLTRERLLKLQSTERQQMLKAYLPQLLTQVTRLPAIDLDWQQSLSSLGLDSLMAAELRKRLETNLGVIVPVEYFVSLSLEQVVKQILLLVESKALTEQLSTVSSVKSGESPQTPNSLWLSRPHLHPQARFRLFCLPYAGAGASIFNSWLAEMPTEIELCPIQLAGRENRRSEPPFNRLKFLIQTLTPLIAPYLDLPFAFFGHSMGALLSFELVRELRRQDLPTPMHLFVSGYPAPQIPDFEPPIHTLPEPQFIEALRKFQGTPEAVLQDSELMQHYLPILRADFAMLETYFYVKEAPLNCPISVFGGLEDKRVSLAALEAWREQTTQGFTVNQLSGDHFFLQLSQKELLKLVLEKFSKQLINQ